MSSFKRFLSLRKLLGLSSYFLIGLMLAFNSISAQKPVDVKYYCLFSDTLSFTHRIPDSVIQEMAAQAVQSRDLPDSLAGKFDSALRKAIAFAGIPTQLRTRHVTATEDTTTVMLAEEVTSHGLMKRDGYKKMIIVNGRKIVAVYDDYNEALPLPPDEDRNFRPTGEIRKILSYLCVGYESEDGKVTIWVTNALPSSINPGVRNVDVEGAILSFSISNQGSLLISTIQKLEIIK